MAPNVYFFKKSNISAFERHIWNLHTTPRYEEPGISLKKREKNHPECGFDMRVSINTPPFSYLRDIFSQDYRMTIIFLRVCRSSFEKSVEYFFEAFPIISRYYTAI